MDQAEFARALGFSRPAYQSYEAGRHSPRDVVAMARRIELLTGVPASWTLGLDDVRAAEPEAPAMHSGHGSGVGGSTKAYRIKPS